MMRDRDGGRRLGFACVALLVTLGVRPPSAAADPAAGTAAFGGPLTLNTTLRRRAANALANLARQELMGADSGVPDSARRSVGLAEQIDPGNSHVGFVARMVDEGRTLPKGRGNVSPLTTRALADLHAAAQQAKASDAKPDRTLAAYLYAAASMATPGGSTEDDQQVADLAQQGITVDWAAIASATPAPAAIPRHAPAPGAVPTSPPTVDRSAPADVPAIAPWGSPTTAPVARPVKEIHGLVVSQAADGRMHGRAIEIIAAPSADAVRRVQVLGTVGREMQVSLAEAVRLVRILRPDPTAGAVDISFDDKYSAKDGGSAGTAFTVLLLSYLGQFDIDPAAAVTGDITVDSKVRPVGEVAAKVHGAALDHCTRVAVPAVNADQMDDAVLLRGPSAVWETQLFTCRTLDDAIALLRADPDKKLTEAMTLFDQLRSQYGKAAPTALAAAGPRATLARILSLVPNDLSAAVLQRLAAGHGPSHLTLQTTIAQAVNAGVPFPMPSRARPGPPAVVDPATEAAARKALRQLAQIGDPAAQPVVAAVQAYVTAFANFSGREHDATATFQSKQAALLRAQSAGEAVRSEVMKLIEDPDVLDRLLHGG